MHQGAYRDRENVNRAEEKFILMTTVFVKFIAACPLNRLLIGVQCQHWCIKAGESLPFYFVKTLHLNMGWFGNVSSTPSKLWVPDSKKDPQSRHTSYSTRHSMDGHFLCPSQPFTKSGHFETIRDSSSVAIVHGEGGGFSAEDVFRPFIPARYIETKREAEMGIETMLSTSPGQYRGVYIRPSTYLFRLAFCTTLHGLVYHAHCRPLTTPAAAALDLSASLHRKVPQGIPTPSQVLQSVANAMTIPPIHVDHVAEAIAISLGDVDINGVVGVRRMRELIGWWPEDHVDQGRKQTETHS
ncbi:hypothetical protein BT96DRAFT_984730 [Gymnopus androsaceus JB14]|uniref:Uncharacterized protein n=1 Tax=Gymnopus androsaceus JB14 TaxID=1447944 RepID=A0A6A4IBZ4_9AGAR|nr:hypothetical protein BT96DRAFT_984730 [Gymnopus androsaceus JB14]